MNVMDFKCVCQHHNNVTLTGEPYLTPGENGSWTINTGDMFCPAYKATDMYGCWNTWIAVPVTR